MADVNTAEVEAKVNAAFIGTVDTPPAPAAKVVEAVPAEPAKPDAKTDPKAAPVAPPERPRYAKVLQQDWDNLKASAGKIFNLESQLAKLAGSAPNADRIAQQVLEKVRSQTPAGLTVEMSDEDFAELTADYPELAKSTRAALEKVFKKASVTGTGPATPPAQPVDVDAAVEKVLLKREQDDLNETYADWSEIVGRPAAPGGDPNLTTDFRIWLGKQSAEYQKKVGETNSPAVVKAAIGLFKASQQETPTQVKPDKAAARRGVIEDAITPRADGNPPPLNQPQSAEDAFGESFKAAKRH